ncbi:NYN domain-containing protein [Falsiroseomonas oryziterrae]|uniref:NYN domain-containing protein n=1 Tax=Falsiroseomonas oryziterrae TaxID=2911368 RepID=UPI001F2420C3|nr:NYN domain-containing protein [Roseomonas sp. NPKOSM-4]
MTDTRPARLAVLIDADNAQPSIIGDLFTEVARYGVPVIRRAYGDWTTPNLGGWKDQLHAHAIKPMQQFAYTCGKNSTDSAMIIDAMDLLHSKRFDGFCLISSDSDFTSLASRIREEGLLALGFGNRQTPQAFVAACNRFIYTDLLRAQHSPPPKAEERQPALQAAPVAWEPAPVELLKNSVEAAADESGWAYLSAVGGKLAQQAPDFDSRRYGHPKLSGLFKSLPEVFEMTRQKQGDSMPHWLVKVRTAA